MVKSYNFRCKACNNELLHFKHSKNVYGHEEDLCWTCLQAIKDSVYCSFKDYEHQYINKAPPQADSYETPDPHEL